MRNEKGESFLLTRWAILQSFSSCPWDPGGSDVQAQAVCGEQARNQGKVPSCLLPLSVLLSLLLKLSTWQDSCVFHMCFQVCLMTSNSLLCGFFLVQCQFCCPSMPESEWKWGDSWTHCLIVAMLLAWVVLTNSYSLNIKPYEWWNRTASVYSNVLGNQECPALERQVATGAWYCSGSGQGGSLVSLCRLPGTLSSCPSWDWALVCKPYGMQWAHTNKQVPKFIPHCSEQPGETFQEIQSPTDLWFAYWREWCVSCCFQGFDPVDWWKLCGKNMW